MKNFKDFLGFAFLGGGQKSAGTGENTTGSAKTEAANTASTGFFWTWVVDHQKGGEDAPLIDTKVRVVRPQSEAPNAQ